jgi:ATP-dependent exoDNAse (exonuclease V) beta subunit
MRLRPNQDFAAALETFEQAPICTIDSFCQRVLQEHAFETRTLFDAEFAADVTAERTRLSDDFWRMRFYGADGILRARLAAAAGSPPPHSPPPPSAATTSPSRI